MNPERKNTLLAGGILAGVSVVGVMVWLATITPSISLTSNAISSTRGGRDFIISGRGFMPIAQTRVLVGGVEATAVTVQSAGTIVARSPQGSDGDAAVTVINPNGRRTTLAGGYRYSAIKPEIDDVSPKVLPAGGGVLVTVKGHGFTATAVEVHFHEEPVPATVISDSVLTFMAPPAPAPVPTNVNVEVSTPDDVWTSDEFGLNYR